MTNLADLAKEFPQDAVHWRVQGTPIERQGRWIARALAYIDARDVMDRLDEVCGPAGWQSRYVETPKGRVLCEIGIRIGDEWVWKSDGAGDTAVEGDKGGISDSLKRAAVQWGIGRYLYRLDAPWVECEVNQKGGKTYFKRWSQDPWSKVKRTSYNAASEAQKPQDDSSAFNHRAAADRIIKRLSDCTTPQALRDAWADEKDTIAQIKAEKPPMFNEINAAKNKAKELMPTEAV